MITQLRNTRHWVFDLDGTLTRPVHDFAHIRSELSLPENADILSAIAAKPVAERKRLNERLDELEYFYAGQAEAAEGVLNLLELLAERGCQFGILTRNKKDVALISLKAIGAQGYFLPEAVLGRDEALAKPDPQGLHMLLDMWRISSGQSVMVGDFRYDLEVGRAAGMATIHVDDRSGRDWPELTDLKVRSMAQLHELLNF